MALSTIFYGNQSKREEVVRKYQRILDLMKDNFYATNQIVRPLQANFTINHPVGRIVHDIDELSVQNGKTISENCDRFLREMSKLQRATAMVRTFLFEFFFGPLLHSLFIKRRPM